MREDTNATRPSDRWDVMIIGGGPAGSTAALYAARGGWSTVVIDKGITAGALGMTSKITNYPGIEDLPPGAELVQRIRLQARQFGAIFETQRITAASVTAEAKTVYAGRESKQGRAVIVATGSMGRNPTIRGEEALIGRGVSYCATCDAFFFADRDTAVIGNSDEAIEEALHVARFAARVRVFCPTPKLRADPDLVRQASDHDGIELHTSARVVEIVGDRHAEAVIVDIDGEVESFSASGVFVYLQGGRPIVDFLGGQLATTEDGCLQVDETFQTSVPGVFAAGDVLCKHIKQAVIAAAEGARAAIAVDRYLSGRSSLKPDWS